MSAVDIVGWSALAVIVVGLVLVAARFRRTGWGVALAGGLVALVTAIVDGAGVWWVVPFALLTSCAAVQIEKCLREGGAK
ncbi:hypothetical protein OHR68_09730 [Spirillospora sp. NBC_00431]